MLPQRSPVVSSASRHRPSASPDAEGCASGTVRDFDRGTHQPGRHGGAVGHTALQVLHALIFDFLSHRTGRLGASYEAIAPKAGACVSARAAALARLRELAY